MTEVRHNQHTGLSWLHAVRLNNKLTIRSQYDTAHQLSSRWCCIYLLYSPQLPTVSS